MNVAEAIAAEAFFKSLVLEEKGSLSLHFNDHQSVYTTARQAVLDGRMNADDFVSEEEFITAMNTNTVWNLQWYPSTPVGFYSLYASSLTAIVTHIREYLATGKGKYT